MRSQPQPGRPVRKCLLGGVLLLTAGLLAPSAAPAQTAPAAKASFNFKNAQSDVLLEALGQLFGVQFVTETPLDRRLTVASAGKVDVEQMVALLDAALRSQGATARQEGKLIRIVPVSLAAARVKMIVLKHSDPKEVAQIVGEIFRTPDLLRETTAQNAELVRKLLAEMEKAGRDMLTGRLRVTAVPYPRLKAVILRAPDVVLPTIERFILTELDKPGPPKPQPKPKPKPKPKPPPPPIKEKIYRPSYVQADYIAGVARRIDGISAFAESRINALILRTNKYEEFDKLEKLIKLLDVPESVRQETTHITLNNAKAEEVRDILNQLFRRTLRLPFTEAGLEALDAEQRQQRIQEATTLLTAAGVNQEVASEFVQTNLGVPFGEVQIITDAGNNALLVRTSPRNLPVILKVIEQLDRPQRQVMINVFIAEVKLDDTLEWGLDFTYQDHSAPRYHTAAMDFNVDLDRTGLTYSFISNNINAFLRALQATTRLDILSRPNVLTLDNHEAIVEFGKRVPLLRTTTITAEGATNSSVQYESVSTVLRVKPHINAAGFVRMDIVQEINDVSPDTFAITEKLAPRILITRRAVTNVQVRDGQTVCLGGFIGDTIDETEEKVPLLGDIPVVGMAFKKIKRTRVKSELLIFLTPYILDTPQELLEMTNAKRRQTMTSREGDRLPEELLQRPVPRPSPYRPWGQTGKSYVIPGRRLEPSGAEAEGEPTTAPAGEPPEAQATQPAATSPATEPAATQAK